MRRGETASRHPTRPRGHLRERQGARECHSRLGVAPGGGEQSQQLDAALNASRHAARQLVASNGGDHGNGQCHVPGRLHGDEHSEEEVDKRAGTQTI